MVALELLMTFFFGSFYFALRDFWVNLSCVGVVRSKKTKINVLQFHFFYFFSYKSKMALDYNKKKTKI